MASPKGARAAGSKTRMAQRVLAAAAPLVLALAACPKPTDGDPQIAVSPGAAGRINLIGSRAGKAKRDAPARARAHTMDAAQAAKLGGPNATGRTGDWVLENEEVVFVVDALSGGGGFAESGGNLVDAADARARHDELGQLFTYFGVFPRQAVYTSLTGREEPDGSAIVEARGAELYEPALHVTTQYRLAGSDRALLLVTTLENTSAAPITLPGVGDAIQWGGAEKVAPGKPVGFKGVSRGPFIGGVGRGVSYAITSTDGEIAAVSGSSWTDTEQQNNVVIAPHASVTYERVFVVGERGDVASITSELTKASGGDVGAVEIALVDANGTPANVTPDAKVIVATPGGDEVMSLVAGKSGTTIVGELPPGRWLLAYAPSAGRRALTAGAAGRVAIEVKKDGTAHARLAVSEVATLTVGCTSGGAPLPCKVTLEGQAGTVTPDLGPAHAATLAKNQMFAVGTRPTAQVPPGRYRLTFSRGPEYTVESDDVVLVGGAAAVEVTKELVRVVDTTGYVATDFHQHTTASADSAVSTRDRIVANVAEAVEVAVVSEHNVVADFAPTVKALGLADYVVHIPGDEVTTDASKKPWGHVNVFPLEVDVAKPRGGAPAARDRLAKDVFDEVRAMSGAPRIIQVNHPRSGLNGYFDQLAFDAKTGVGQGAGYATGFDALEVWNGRNVEARDKVLGDYFALLRTSRPVTAIADTDTHGIVGHEAGLPRTYVKVAKDDALGAWDGRRTADVVASVRELRDVVLTNGPFLQVTANGAGIGGVARARSGLVDVRVRITCTSFTAVERIELRSVNGATVVGAASVTVTPRRSATGALEADAKLTVRAARDDAFVVIASGSRPMRPVFFGDEAEITPWAMSGAIWIDADGDGSALGRREPRILSAPP